MLEGQEARCRWRQGWRQLVQQGVCRHWRGAATDESYEKRQVLWEGMTDRGWSELVQQWGLPVVESL